MTAALMTAATMLAFGLWVRLLWIKHRASLIPFALVACYFIAWIGSGIYRDWSKWLAGWP